ncbi:MAG TPA: ABC transporter permease [Anaerolineae bacterium]|nr:ABC transporter permease [Anaerolineae bacterium]
MVTVEKTPGGLVVSVESDLSLITRIRYLTVSTLGHLLELWQYRELIRNLVVRDLKVRYRNSVLGILWSLFNPLLMMLVFTLVFTVMTRPYSVDKFPIFVLCAILPWNFFSAAVIGSIRSIIDNSALVNKVYFPREILTISVILAGLVNFLIALLVLFPLLFIFQISLTPWILFLPAIVVVQLLFTLGFGMLMATANVFYRDTQVIMEVLMLAWFFMTPIFYPFSILNNDYQLWEGVSIDISRWARILNPMASIIENYRTILYNGAPPEPYFFFRTFLTALGMFIVGLLVFRIYSRRFGEEV